MDLGRQLDGYRLVTASILYHLPDHPRLLQEFIWQHYDKVPKYPELQQFLAFWEEKIEGRLHSVRVGTTGLLTPGRWQAVQAEWTLSPGGALH